MGRQKVYETERGPMTRYQIAAVTGLSPEAISYRIRTGLDLFAEKNPPRDTLFDTPYGRITAKEIAERAGVSTAAVYQRMARWPDQPARWCMPRGYRHMDWMEPSAPTVKLVGKTSGSKTNPKTGGETSGEFTDDLESAGLL